MQVRNSITLIGNLGAHPKVSTTEAGLTITEFNLATNDYFRDKEGNRQTRTDWHKVKAFGKLGDVLGKYLEQGSQVAIVGSLRYHKWIDKHDQVRISPEIIAHSFTFLSGGRHQEAEQALAEEAALPVAKSKKSRKKQSAAPANEVIPF